MTDTAQIAGPRVLAGFTRVVLWAIFVLAILVGLATLVGRFDPTPIAFGFLLMLVGLAFEHGARLQKDTEGLA